MKYLSDRQIETIKNGELGYVSSTKFMEILEGIKDGITVDIGVYQGQSSSLMINRAAAHNVQVYGIDPIPCFTTSHPYYHYIKDDSVKIGKEWDKGQIDLAFFDSVHAKEQVLCELYYWWDHIKEGGYALFHDTSWKDYVHKPGHHGAGRKPGNSHNGYDSYGGIDWETPDKAVNEFFGVNLYPENRDINKDEIVIIHEDEFVKIEHNQANLGMTFIQKKKHFDYKSNISQEKWDEIFKRREILLSFFK